MPNAFDDIPDTPIASPPVSAAAPKGNAFDDISPPVKTTAPTPTVLDNRGQPWKDDWVQQAGRQVGLAGRAIINGISGLPAMAADTGVAVRNLGYNLSHGIMPTLADFNPFAKSGGSHQEYELPSHSFNQALTAAGVPEPRNISEKVANFVESGLTGSRMPVPQASEQAPANFVRPADAQRAVAGKAVQDAQDAGYVVPPATSNRTTANSLLETIGGKQAVQQVASARNQAVTDQLAKEALGLNPDSPLTAEAAAATRAEAGQSYEALRGAGTIEAGESFRQRLAQVLSKYRGADRSFPGLGKTDLSDIVDKVDKPSFDAGDAVDAMRILRDKASVAYRAGDTGTGQGLKEISGAIEGAIEKDLSQRGPEYADLLGNFRGARQQIAISHTVEDALNPATGHVNAAKLGAALRRGEPLSGNLLDIAKMANAFPKAVQEPTHSLGVSHLDMYAPLMTATFGHGLAEKAAGAAIPAARWGARGYLFSPWGQAGAIPGAGAPATGAFPMGLIGAQQSTR